MVDRSCKKLKMEKGKDKDTFNLTFILMVEDRELPNPGKNASPVWRCKEKKRH